MLAQTRRNSAELKDELQAHVTGSWNELQRLLAEKSQEVVDRPEWWEETELGQSLKDTGMEDTLLAQMESSDTVPMSADDLKAALTAFTRAGYQGRWKDSSMKVSHTSSMACTSMYLFLFRWAGFRFRTR